MKIQKDMIVGINPNVRMPKYFKSFLFMSLYNEDDGVDEVEVEVFCHKPFTIQGNKYKKNELKGTKYKFKIKNLI